MKHVKPYALEYGLMVATLLVSVLGFWKIYFGESADPNAFHHLHVVTNAIWLGLLFYQLRLVGNMRFGDHRRVGLAILAIAPLLVATTALLSVRSAYKGIVSGQCDFLIVQNVDVLISFVPQFKIEGPETFYRFGTAAITGQVICVVVALLFVVKDFRHGWPLLLAAVFFPLNDVIRFSLDKHKLIGPLTEFVASGNQPLTFIASFGVMLALLAATGMLSAKRRGATP